MKKLLLNDNFILTLIIINGLLIFIESFNGLDTSVKSSLLLGDRVITVIFIFEMAVKIRQRSFAMFIGTSWNKFDFIIILVSAVTLMLSFFSVYVEDLSFILILRVSRIFKAFRFLRFVPNLDKMISGIKRAVKASVLVLLGLIVYNFILAVFSCFLFGKIAPQYFGNPLQSLYSIFKIFTVEGWFTIPETIASHTSEFIGTLTTFYFIIILLTGGILGLSLLNSIFVDAMVADNNDALEKKVDKLTEQVEKLNAHLTGQTRNNE